MSGPLSVAADPMYLAQAGCRLGLDIFTNTVAYDINNGYLGL